MGPMTSAVLEYIRRTPSGATKRDIMAALGIGLSTVEKHLYRLLDAELVQRVASAGSLWTVLGGRQTTGYYYVAAEQCRETQLPMNMHRRELYARVDGEQRRIRDRKADLEAPELTVGEGGVL